MNLLLAATLLMQDKTAEDAIRTIESTIDSARSVTLAYKEQGTTFSEGKEQKSYVISGVLLLKGNNKASISEEHTRIVGTATTKNSNFLVSDGSRIIVKIGETNEVVTGETPELLHPFLCTALARDPMRFLIGYMGYLAKKDPIFLMNPDPKSKLRLPKLDSVQDDDGKKVLSFTEPGLPGEVISGKLWFDPGSHKILKRIREISFGKGDGRRFSEACSYEFSFNTDIPDEKFKLPEEKK